MAEEDAAVSRRKRERALELSRRESAKARAEDEAAKTKRHELRLADLPGIDEVTSIEQLDIRSGAWDAGRDRLTGGHVWLAGLRYVEPAPRAAAVR